MNKTFLLLSLAFSTSAFALTSSADFPISRLKGLYTYQEHFQVANIRRAETVSSVTSQGQERIKELRSQGYSCIHKDPQTRLCSKNWKPAENPAGMDEAVRKFMSSVQVEFEGSDNLPKLVHDGSTTQEWEVSEKVRIIETQVNVYRVVRNNDGQIYIAFPVNENQPMSPLKYHDISKLGMTMIGQAKDTETSTVAYTIEAFLEN